MSTGVRPVRDDRLAQTVEYAYASVADAPVRVIWTAGACPLDTEGRTVAVGSYAGQTHQVMRNLVTALAGVGASLSDVVKTTVHVASPRRSDLVEAWEVYREYMGAHDAPSTLLGVTVLGYADQLVEVEAVAVATGAPGPRAAREDVPAR
ncbi:RidA family protein [Streptomyces sp. Wb2n-11]|uniref:RidA family protein n=1 Tax=Streptomyces sp. Wb2n-11 TaxID=1030533 RepID=UPI000B883774|nr:RidA family protein [Streptomyces sp. Wb2n-11]